MDRETHSLSSPRRLPIIGLLGAPGSGKSAVARLLRELGCGVIDADQLARQALERQEVKESLRAWWGPEVLDAAGRVDRAAVGRLVFDRPAELKRLEMLTHPIVNRHRQEARHAFFAQAGIRAIVEDCPLLLEAGLDGDCDALVYVDADQKTREDRVRATRGWEPAELARRESRQWPLDIKRQAADYVVRNTAGLDDLKLQVDSVLRQILQRFQADAPDPADSQAARDE